MSKRLPVIARCLLIVCCLALLSKAARAEPEVVQKLANGIYVWQGNPDKREPANCMWVIFKDYVVVIDANFPWAAREIIQKIKATTDKPIRYVLNTHYHSDHSLRTLAQSSSTLRQPTPRTVPAKTSQTGKTPHTASRAHGRR